MFAVGVLPGVLALAGCTSGSPGTSNSSLSVSPGTAAIDTNCTGCNTTNSSNQAVEQFSATLSGGAAASVNWSVSGGDASSGAGSINANGQYTPPPYLTADSVQVTVTATLAAGNATQASATVTITPGFLQPLSPENVALGSGGSVTITGTIAEAGGTTGITYALSSTSGGSSGGQGSLGATGCIRNAKAFTFCSVTYSAPVAVSSTGATFVVASVGTPSSTEAVEVLLNTEGIDSNPATHQTLLATPIQLGSSGGNNNDYDTITRSGQTFIADCCGGTLGSLIQDKTSGTQYLLSCNHVLARSDQAVAGEMIVQPGLIDNNCTPNGDGSGTTPVGSLTAWLPLSSTTTNVDAAIAQVDSNAVDPTGKILELGIPTAPGPLPAASPGTSCTIASSGTSCTAGQGETASLNLLVAKSGRTTGLTCAGVSATSLDVQVSYFKNCGETEPYLTKIYTNQIAIEGKDFSDAGDSGSLVVDAANAEPIGLFFAGGVTSSGISEGVANPAPTVLAELGAQQGTTYAFVGTTDHPVSCLNYGNATATAAQAVTLTPAETTQAAQALSAARMLVDPSAGILGVAAGKSNDRSGEAAVIFYVDQNTNPVVPQTIDGVRTQVIPTTAEAVAEDVAPRSPAAKLPPLSSTAISQAIAVKQQIVSSLMKQNPAFFGVGVGQSLDDPREASLVVYVDRKQVPATLPPTIDGMRARYVVMDRLHVTRSYLTGPARAQSHCMPHQAARQPDELDPFHIRAFRGLKIF